MEHTTSKRLRPNGVSTGVHRLAIFFLLALGSAVAQQTSVPGTTTLQEQLANNTSAADSFKGTANGNVAAGNVSKVPISALMYRGATTKYLAAMQGWFGSSKHVSVGYRSDDRAQVRRQLLDMRSRGFDGVSIAWYGSDPDETSNRTTQLVKSEAERIPGFVFALRVNQGAVKWYAHGLPPTDALIRHLNYAADTYFTSPAYMRVNGRPVVFEFGLESLNLDWNRIHSEVQGNPIWIFRNPSGFTRPFSAGAFAWGPADKMEYLDEFYAKAVNQPNKIAVGNTFKGFDDHLADWGKNRVNDQRCGQTWLDTFGEIRRFYSANNQLPMVMVSTWNDYEEGSEIESGIDNCLSLSASVQGPILRWTPQGNGNENTINHYVVFASTDGDHLRPLAELRNNEHTLDLTRYSLAAGSYTLYVQAVGQPSIRNVMSNPVALKVP